MPNEYFQPEMSQRLSTQEEIRRAVDEIDFLASGFWDEEENIPIQESILKQFVPLDSNIRGEEGQNSKEWSEVLDDFGSKRVYQERLSDFLHFASLDYSSATLEMKLVNYFNDAKAQTNPDGSPRYRATTFRSWLSIFTKFWRHCKLKDLKALVPTLEDKIGKWEKKQIEVKQAKCFSREQLTSFFEMPTTVDNLLDKAYAAIALSFAARGAEVTTIMWDDVTQSVNTTTKETVINIRFQRSKVTGVPEKMLALITGRLEIKAIMEYAACFSDDQQTGRYFRKLCATRGGVGITNTKQNVGHNMLAKTAYRIAIRLGLESPILYTGHTFRRSAATICAESGMTLPEIKLVTGQFVKYLITILY
jgi:integrase